MKQRKQRKALYLGALFAVIGMTLAACSSSTSGDNAGSNTTNNSSPSSVSTASAVDYDQVLAEAKKVFPDHYEGPTEPAKAPAGIKVAAISCTQQLQGCVDLSAGVMEAAKAAGWEGRTFDGKGTPTEQNSQILDAVNWGAKVILLIAVDPKTVQIGLKAAKKAGAVLISCNNAGSSPNPKVDPPAGYVWTIGDVLQDQTRQGKIQADWMIADSKGTANVLALNDNGFISVKPNIDGFLNELATCPGCKSDKVTFASADVGPKLGQQVVSYLRTHSDVNYIFVPYDPAVPAIVSALHTAGMNNKVKISAYLGNKQNLQLVKNNDVQYADVAEDCNYTGWAMVDQAIRALNGQPNFEPWSENSPMQLLTADNLPSDITKSWDAPFDYRSKYIALWK